MSERGIEIHNGEVVFPEGMPQTLHIGTEASPLTQGEASQIVISAVINAIALGGTVKAGEFIVIASVDMTGNLYPLIAKSIVNDGITVSGFTFGALIETSILGTGIVTAPGTWEGLRINMGMAAGAEILEGVRGIFLSGYNLGTIPASSYHFIRCQENGTVTVYCGLYFRAGTGGIDYFALLHGDHDAWRANCAALTGITGRIRVHVGGMERWIQLYDTAP